MTTFFRALVRRKTYSGKAGTYGYRKYRAEIAEDCQYRCVYCDSHLMEIGGSPMMELDHFRPESLFALLAEEPTNLVFACRSCNRLKWHDWPAGEGDTCVVGDLGYIDPFASNRGDFFQVGPQGEIVALKPPARYVERRLALNRPLLKRLRLRTQLIAEARKAMSNLTARLETRLAKGQTLPEDAALMRAAVQALKDQCDLLDLIDGGPNGWVGSADG